MALTYSQYLKLPELLDLQKPLTPGEHDELLFITIHQVYELWFKQILHEVQSLEHHFDHKNTPMVLATLKRVLTILKTMVGQVDILETMTPLSFLSFRERLESSSGFQSWQFRKFEFILGKRSVRVLAAFEVGSKEREELENELKRPTLYDHFLKFLNSEGYAVPSELLRRDYSLVLGENVLVQDALLKVYRQAPILAQICERLVDLDEGVQEWRYRHVKMVERTIGFKQGTGGSPGVEYLRATLFQPLFPDLWAIRTRF